MRGNVTRQDFCPARPAWRFYWYFGILQHSLIFYWPDFYKRCSGNTGLWCIYRTVPNGSHRFRCSGVTGVFFRSPPSAYSLKLANGLFLRVGCCPTPLGLRSLCSQWTSRTIAKFWRYWPDPLDGKNFLSTGPLEVSSVVSQKLLSQNSGRVLASLIIEYRRSWFIIFDNSRSLYRLPFSKIWSTWNNSLYFQWKGELTPGSRNYFSHWFGPTHCFCWHKRK